MEPALSRIEREYVISSMEEEKPPLLIVCGSLCSAISGEGYSIDGEEMLLDRPLPFGSGAVVRVFFSHRKRGVFFDAPLPGSAGTQASRLVLGRDIYKEQKREASQALPDITLLYESRMASVKPASWFILEPAFSDPSRILSNPGGVAQVAERLGIPPDSSAAARSFEFLVSLRESPAKDRADRGGFLSFIDETACTCTLSKDYTSRIPDSAPVEASIRYRRRTIKAKALLSGRVSVDPKTDLAAFRFMDIQEEDKRFLHERAYLRKYE